jgi:hypothetical protein
MVLGIVYGLGATELIILIILFIFLAPFALGIYILSKYLWGDYKACPHCAEKIKGAARICRYCGREVIHV